MSKKEKKAKDDTPKKKLFKKPESRKKDGKAEETDLKLDRLVFQDMQNETAENPDDGFDGDIFEQPSPSAEEHRQSRLEAFFSERIEKENSEPPDPKKESIFYFDLPDDPPKEPEPIHVDGVPVYESPVRLRYKKRNRRPLSITARAILTVLGVIAVFGAIMLIIWLTAA